MIAQNKPVIAYVWAACDKDPGYTPYTILENMSRNSKYRPEDLEQIDSKQIRSLQACKELFFEMYHEAQEKFKYAPIAEYGTLYLRKEDLSVFFPNKDDFTKENFIRHKGRPFGSVPQIIQSQAENNLVPSKKTYRGR
jgi:hypothetical protein